MSVHDSALISDFFVVFKSGYDFFPLSVVFRFSLFMPAAILDDVKSLKKIQIKKKDKLM